MARLINRNCFANTIPNCFKDISLKSSKRNAKNEATIAPIIIGKIVFLIIAIIFTLNILAKTTINETIISDVNEINYKFE
jgi:hypothetical protein